MYHSLIMAYGGEVPGARVLRTLRSRYLGGVGDGHAGLARVCDVRQDPGGPCLASRVLEEV